MPDIEGFGDVGQPVPSEPEESEESLVGIELDLGRKMLHEAESRIPWSGILTKRVS